MKRIALGVLALAVVVGIVFWWRARRVEESVATPATVRDASTRAETTPAARPALDPASLEVRVTDSAGPIANAAVHIAPADGEVVVATTNAAGVATTTLPPGSYDISASAPGHEPAALPTTELAAGQHATFALALAVGGRALVGTVTDVSGGPVAGARVDAAALQAGARPGRAIATAFTGTDGRYALAVREGQHLVGVRSADYAAQARYVDVGAAGATADFALVPGGMIEGVVLDEHSKEPVPGAVVAARRDGGEPTFGQASTLRASAGPDGRFRLAGLSPGAYELGATRAARRTRSTTVVGIGVAEQVPEVTLLVGAGLAVRGTVVDEAGAPVPGAQVVTRTADDLTATTDATGAFTLEGLPPGKHLLHARGDAHLPTRPVPVAVIDKDVTGVVLRVTAGLHVRGHVEPRQVATVQFEPTSDPGGPRLRSAPVTTGPDGTFDLGPVPAGDAELAVACPTGDQGSLAVAVTPQLGEVVVKVAPGGSIAGRVLDGKGAPVAGISVMAALGDDTSALRFTIVNGAMTGGTQAITGATGTYEIRGLRAGSYRISALERGRPVRPRSPIAPVTLAAAEAKRGVDLAIDRADGTISGVVVGSDGQPIADAWVSATLELGSLLEGTISAGRGRRMITVEESSDGPASTVAPVLTDAQGRFAIAGLHDGRYEIVAEAQAGKLRGRLAEVTPNATVTVKAVGLASLSGTVTGPAGPVRLFTIELAGPTRTTRTFTDGHFELGRVDPGSYEVRVTSTEGNGKARVTVAPETPTAVAIAVVANAVMVGTLVDPAGTPVAGVGLALIEDRPDAQIRFEGLPPTTGPDGAFRLEHEAGPVALVVLAPTGPILRRGFKLEAGKTLEAGAIVVAPAGTDDNPPRRPIASR